MGGFCSPKCECASVVMVNGKPVSLKSSKCPLIFHAASEIAVTCKKKKTKTAQKQNPNNNFFLKMKYFQTFDHKGGKHHSWKINHSKKQESAFLNFTLNCDVAPRSLFGFRNLKVRWCQQTGRNSAFSDEAHFLHKAALCDVTAFRLHLHPALQWKREDLHKSFYERVHTICSWLSLDQSL